ncbi:MAG: GNAT family N-acetyltransferase [Verrucomicrobia subdivision 3 bacterium]|nr:GNAT family N-acetyltransferase [Limisphaerales bacterium]
MIKDIHGLLELYERELRLDCEPLGMRREAFPTLIRLVDLAGERGCVIYSKLDERGADAAICKQIDYFGSIHQAFEWKLFGYDGPPDLGQRLLRVGFEAEPVEAVMVLELDQAPPALDNPRSHDVRRITSLDELVDLERVQCAIWKETRWILSRVQRDMTEAPETLSVYVAYSDGKPVCAGWIDFPPHSQFAGVWGGSTIPEFRRRGFYCALLAARVREARERGRRFLTIDAGPMSRPIVERSGFQFLTSAQEFVWKPDMPDIQSSQSSQCNP